MYIVDCTPPPPSHIHITNYSQATRHYLVFFLFLTESGSPRFYTQTPMCTPPPPVGISLSTHLLLILII